MEALTVIGAIVAFLALLWVIVLAFNHVFPMEDTNEEDDDSKPLL